MQSRADQLIEKYEHQWNALWGSDVEKVFELLRAYVRLAPMQDAELSESNMKYADLITKVLYAYEGGEDSLTTSSDHYNVRSLLTLIEMELGDVSTIDPEDDLSAILTLIRRAVERDNEFINGLIDIKTLNLNFGNFKPSHFKFDIPSDLLAIKNIDFTQHVAAGDFVNIKKYDILDLLGDKAVQFEFKQFNVDDDFSEFSQFIKAQAHIDDVILALVAENEERLTALLDKDAVCAAIRQIPVRLIDAFLTNEELSGMPELCVELLQKAGALNERMDVSYPLHYSRVFDTSDYVDSVYFHKHLLDKLEMNLDVAKPLILAILQGSDCDVTQLYSKLYCCQYDLYTPRYPNILLCIQDGFVIDIDEVMCFALKQPFKAHKPGLACTNASFTLFAECGKSLDLTRRDSRTGQTPLQLALVGAYDRFEFKKAIVGLLLCADLRALFLSDKNGRLPIAYAPTFFSPMSHRLAYRMNNVCFEQVQACEKAWQSKASIFSYLPHELIQMISFLITTSHLDEVLTESKDKAQLMGDIAPVLCLT